MLNEEKVRIMTQLASYEQGEGKKYLPVSKYYRSDFIGLALIKNFFLTTIAYCLIAAIGAGYFAEELLDNIHKMNIISLGVGLLLGYLIFLVSYSLITYIVYSVKYSRAKKSVKKYYATLGKMAQMYGPDETKMKSKTQVSRRRK